jgi:peptidoglycan hydrolase CwlO-like protein
MKRYLSVLMLLCSIVAGKAYAEIYKHVDADGHTTYSNIKSKGATRLDVDPAANTIGSGRSPTPKRTATPSSFPRVDKNTQYERDGKRRDILQKELESEQAALAQAQKAYAEGESNPEVFTTPTGATLRNVPKFQEKMQRLQTDVDNHQKNIELLQKELDALK